MLEELRKYPLTTEDKEVVKEWERRLKKDSLYKTFQEHPVSLSIASEIIESIRRINQGLIEGIYTEEQRNELVIKRKVWSDFLSLFGNYDTKEIVEQEINESIKTFKDYYGTN